MTRLPEKLRLKGTAEEDIYFARRDRELIAALHARRLKKLAKDVAAPVARREAVGDRQSRAEPAADSRRAVRRTGAFYRGLLERALRLLGRHR